MLREDEPKFPASRVQGPDRQSYVCTFTTHFTQAAVEVLQEPEDWVRAPLGLLHGFPCYLQLMLEKDEYVLYLISDFISEFKNGFDTPAGVGQDDDSERGFEFTVVRGSVGAIELTPRKTYETTVTGAYPIPVCSSEDGLVCNADGNLKVELVLEVCQHKHC